MKKKILVIDDDQKLNQLLKEYLAKFGFTVTSYTHPQQGLKALKQDLPDLIILDIMLPDMDGFEACKKIRQDYSVPIIMLTARGEVTDRIVGLELEETNILNLVREVCVEFHDRKPGIKLVSFPGDIFLNVDPKRIKILFRNILDNALRYCDPDGYPVEISLREKADEIIIAVQDFGSGIPGLLRVYPLTANFQYSQRPFGGNIVNSKRYNSYFFIQGISNFILHPLG